MNSRIARTDKEFKEILEKISIDRIKIGMDKKQLSDRRLSKAIARLIKKDPIIYSTLIKSPLEDDNKKRGRKLRLL